MIDPEIIRLKEAVDRYLDEEAKDVVGQALLPKKEVFLTRGRVNGIKALVLGPVPLLEESPSGVAESRMLSVFHPQPLEDPEMMRWELKEFEELLLAYREGLKSEEAGQYLAESVYGMHHLISNLEELTVHLAEKEVCRTFRIKKRSPTGGLVADLGARFHIFAAQMLLWSVEKGVATVHAFGTFLIEGDGDYRSVITFSIPRRLNDGRED